MKVTCTFDRIGRTHDVDPLVCGAPDGDWGAVADQVYRYARPMLTSSGVEVVVNENGGTIFAGVQNAGTITVSIEADAAPVRGESTP